MNKDTIINLFRQILCEIEGIDNPYDLRKGLKESPERIADMYEEIFEGYEDNADKYVKLFDEKHDEVIISKDIEFYSICEHHLVPFFGTVDIAYLPCDTILGISKLARLVDHFAHRLNIQEKMTTDLANFLMKCDLKPKGVMVIVRATHLCEVMRGVKKKNPIMITSAVRGSIFKNPDLRNEIMFLIGRGE